MLGTLASRTGGAVLSEKSDVDAAAYGAGLAQAVHGSVFWPTAANAVKWPEGLDVYPKTLPPLRSDRDTVVVGTAKSTAASQLNIDVDGAAGAQRLAFDIPAMKPDANNAYLVTLVDQAKVDGGRTLPLVDSASLATARQEIEAGGRGLNDLAFKDLHSGNLEHANTLASQALARNPSDLVARAIKDDIAKQANGAIALAAGPAAAPPGRLPLRRSSANRAT